MQGQPAPDDQSCSQGSETAPFRLQAGVALIRTLTCYACGLSGTNQPTARPATSATTPATSCVIAGPESMAGAICGHTSATAGESCVPTIAVTVAPAASLFVGSAEVCLAMIYPFLPINAFRNGPNQPPAPCGTTTSGIPPAISAASNAR
jgi:hypothetical protein